MRSRFFLAVLPFVVLAGPTLGQRTPIGTLEIKSAGKRIHSAIMSCHVSQTAVVERVPDAYSAKLFQSRNEHEVLAEVILRINSTSDPKKYKVVTLHNAVVQSIADQKTPSGGSEVITFSFGQIQVLYYSGGLASTDSW